MSFVGGTIQPFAPPTSNSNAEANIHREEEKNINNETTILMVNLFERTGAIVDNNNNGQGNRGGKTNGRKNTYCVIHEND